MPTTGSTSSSWATAAAYDTSEAYAYSDAEAYYNSDVDIGAYAYADTTPRAMPMPTLTAMLTAEAQLTVGTVSDFKPRALGRRLMMAARLRLPLMLRLPTGSDIYGEALPTPRQGCGTGYTMLAVGSELAKPRQLRLVASYSNLC